MPVINASLDSFEFKERVIKEGESNFRKEIPKEVQNNAQNHEKSTKPIKVGGCHFSVTRMALISLENHSPALTYISNILFCNFRYKIKTDV